MAFLFSTIDTPNETQLRVPFSLGYESFPAFCGAPVLMDFGLFLQASVSSVRHGTNFCLENLRNNILFVPPLIRVICVNIYVLFY